MKKNRKRILSVILALGMLFGLVTPVSSQAAKKAPKLNKKKLTLTVGDTAKLKVKNTKKKIKWSSSKKAVATVTKKGKIKAKKAGKTTITAKVGKKKLTCKVTVKAKKQAAGTPTTKPNTSSGGNAGVVKNNVTVVQIVHEKELKVTLTNKQNLSKDNFSLKVKRYGAGDYKYGLQIKEVSSKNQLQYTLTLGDDYSLLYGDTIQLTVSGLIGTGSVTKEVLYKETVEKTTEMAFTYEVGQRVNQTIWLEGYGYPKMFSLELPEGLSYEVGQNSYGKNYMKVTGNPQKAGKYVEKIVYKDEFNSTYIIDVQWLIGDEDTLFAYCDKSYTYIKDKPVTVSHTSSRSTEISVVGGSGEYTFKVLDSDATIDLEKRTLSKTFETAGVYTMNVEVTDVNNEELKTTFPWIVTVEQARKIDVTVKDKEGTPLNETYRYLKFKNQDSENPDTLSFQNSGKGVKCVTIWAVDGVYDISVSMEEYEYIYRDYKVAEKDAKLEISLPNYKTTEVSTPEESEEPEVTPTPQVTPAPTKEPTQTETPDMSGIIKEIRIEGYKNLQVTLKQEKELTAENFVIKRKKYKEGSYNYTFDKVTVSTEDKIHYSLTLGDTKGLEATQYVQVEIIEVEGVGTSVKEAVYAMPESTDMEFIYTYQKGDTVSGSVNMGKYSYFGLISKEGLPQGIDLNLKSYEGTGYTFLEIKGTLEMVGEYHTKIVLVDEFEQTYTIKIHWYVGSETTIVAGANPMYGVYKSSKTETNSHRFYVSGGSGEYIYEVEDENVTVNSNSKTLKRVHTEAGNFEFQVKVTDANDANLSTTFTVPVYVKQATKNIFRVKDGKGNYISGEFCSIYAVNHDTNSLYQKSTSYSSSRGEELDVWLVEGTYDIEISVNGFNYPMETPLVVKEEETEVIVQIPLYEVVIEEDQYNIKNVNWYDEKNIKRGNGFTFYLPEGSYTLTGELTVDTTKYTFEVATTVSATAEENVATLQVVNTETIATE